MPETKAQKFERLASGRLATAIKSIGLMENLIRSDYESNPVYRAEIVGDLYAAVDQLASRWKVGGRAPIASDPPPAPGTGFAVDGCDRRDIRVALRQIRGGDAKGGIKAIEKVVLGWTVPDKISTREE